MHSGGRHHVGDYTMVHGSVTLRQFWGCQPAVQMTPCRVSVVRLKMGFLGARIKMGNPMFPTQDVDQQTGILMTETYDIPVTYPKRSFLLVTQIDPEMFVGVTHLSPPVDLNQFVGSTLDQNLGTSTSLQFWMFIPFI